MSEDPKPVRLEEVDWPRILPVVHVFSSFRMAIHPAVLLPSFLLVLLLVLGGNAWDAGNKLLGDRGDRAFVGEVDAFAERSTGDFRQWRQTRRNAVRDQLYVFAMQLDAGSKFGRADADAPDAFDRVEALIEENYRAQRATHERISKDAATSAALPNDSESEFWLRRAADIETTRRAHLARLATIRPQGVFATSTRFLLDSLDRMASAATQGRFGVDQLRPGGTSMGVDRTTVWGALRDIAFVLPAWLACAHPVFLVVFGLFALAAWALLGGSVSRLAAWRIARKEWLPLGEALAYAKRHATSAFVTPLVPLGLSALFFVLVWAAAFLAFGLPYVHRAGDVIGGAGYGLVLLLSLAGTLCLVGLALAGGLLLPATASDGADAFDAVERAFGYLIGRPWQVLGYNAAALVYGAVTYFILNMVAFVALSITHAVAGNAAGALAEKSSDMQLSPERFQAIHHAPAPGRLSGDLDWWMGAAPSDWPGRIGSFLVALWVIAFVMLLAAYVVGYFACAQTWIYSLVRRSTDGTDLSEVYSEPAPRAVKPDAPATPAPPATADATPGSESGATP